MVCILIHMDFHILLQDLWAEWHKEIIVGAIIPAFYNWIRKIFLFVFFARSPNNNNDILKEDQMIKHLSEIEKMAEKWVYNKPFTFKELRDVKELIARYLNTWFSLPDNFKATTDFFTPEFLAHITECRRTIKRKGYREAEKIIKRKIRGSLPVFSKAFFLKHSISFLWLILLLWC